MAKEKKADKEKSEKKKKVMNVWKLYSSKDGKLERKNQTCPKCGDGVFMARHQNRMSCGKCGFTEFMSKEKK